MSDCIIFIGDPGPDAKDMLAAIREAGLSAKRIESTEHAVSILEKEPPCAVILDGSMKNIDTFLEELREVRSLAAVPVLLRVSSPDPVLLADAFRWGVDDFLVDGCAAQFSAFAATIGNKESWSAVRAPAGQVILAHADRYERAKVGRILRRNGFDTFFAGSIDELAAAIQGKDARTVIVSCDIPGGSVESMLLDFQAKSVEVPPFVLVAKPDDIETIRCTVPESVRVKYFESGTDPEGVTFVLNELLAPPPAGARRSARVLWGTPVTFRHQGGEADMYGFSFNINMGGIYIRSLTSLPLQTKIDVAFRPPFGRGHVFAEAQVVWRKQPGDSSGAASPPGMGVQFLDLWPADQAAYEAGYQALLEQSSTSPSAAAPHPTQVA